MDGMRLETAPGDLERGHPDSTLNCFLRELPSIIAATMGSDRTEMTLPDENVACTVGN